MMNHKVLVTTMLAALLVWTGCTRQMTSGAIRPDAASVSVRFVLPGVAERHAGSDAARDAQLAVDSDYRGFSGLDNQENPAASTPRAYHVALWGGPYNGVNVTTGPTMLVPGSYTFAYFDQPNESVVQGWLDVHHTGSDLVNVLTQWRRNIPEQRQRLAYEYEIDGSMGAGDPEVLKGFQKQMRAYDQIEHRLDAAIQAEQRAAAVRRQGSLDLLRQADVVILPGEDTFFRSTTRPAFSDEELEAVRRGDPVTKLILVADYDEAQSKLRQVNQLYNDLSRFKEVLREEVDRLERRKGLFLLTDHLHHHDGRFVENEVRLQYVLSLIDGFNRHTADLRERRMGLAFVASLFAPDADDSALDQELRDLLRERTVLETERQRLDELIAQVDGSSARLVTLERNRQDVVASIEAVDRQLTDVDEAQTALAIMAGSTEVIHRQNDRRLMTTTFVADTLPFGVRRAVEHEAMMTVRLQASDKVFAPRPGGVAFAAPAPMPFYANEPVPVRDQDTRYVEATYRTTYEGPSERPHCPATVVSDRDEPAREPRQADRPRPTRGGEPCGCHWFVRWLVPPCWFAGRTDQPAQTTTACREGQPCPTTTLASHRDEGEPAKEPCHCSWLVRLLVPPCWFAD